MRGGGSEGTLWRRLPRLQSGYGFAFFLHGFAFVVVDGFQFLQPAEHGRRIATAVGDADNDAWV